MDDGKQVVAYVNDECVSCGWGDLNLGVQGDGRKASTSTDKETLYHHTHLLYSPFWSAHTHYWVG
jgi:hypothetical protein